MFKQSIYKRILCLVLVCVLCVATSGWGGAATSAFADMRMDTSCLGAQLEQPSEIEKAVKERRRYGVKENGIFVPLPEWLRDLEPKDPTAHYVPLKNGCAS